ncbi:MAG: hypothetical protein ACRDJU_05940 [Actinomycetota bacterium]
MATAPKSASQKQAETAAGLVLLVLVVLGVLAWNRWHSPPLGAVCTAWTTYVSDADALGGVQERQAGFTYALDQLLSDQRSLRQAANVSGDQRAATAAANLNTSANAAATQTLNAACND